MFNLKTEHSRRVVFCHQSLLRSFHVLRSNIMQSEPVRSETAACLKATDGIDQLALLQILLMSRIALQYLFLQLQLARCELHIFPSRLDGPVRAMD